MLSIGAILGSVEGLHCLGSFLTPAEAHNIDNKVDDGSAGKGSVISGRWADCTLAANVTDYDAAYDLTADSIECALTYLID